jgi:hypothetical protein
MFWYDRVAGITVLAFSLYDIFLEEKRKRAEKKKAEEELERFLGGNDEKPLN